MDVLFMLVSISLVQVEETPSSQIAFAMRMDGQSGIHVTNGDGSQPRHLTTDGNDLLPTWSPNGKRIAFLSLRQQDHALVVEHDLAFHWFLYAMDADGRRQRRVTATPIGLNFQWSPDGTSFLFQSSYEDLANRGKDGTVSSAIYVMAVDGSNQKRLTSIDGIDGSPTWSPDGNRIAFSSNRHGSMDIFVMNSDGSGLLRLTDNPANESDPIWSPDGNQIAFASIRKEPAGSAYVVRPDATDEKLVSSKGAPVEWSKDGSRLLVTKGSQLAVVTADGRNHQPLTEPGIRALNGIFSADGASVMYRVTGRDGWEIRTIGVESGHSKRIAGNSGTITSFSVWSENLSSQSKSQ